MSEWQSRAQPGQRHERGAGEYEAYGRDRAGAEGIHGDAADRGGTGQVTSRFAEAMSGSVDRS